MPREIHSEFLGGTPLGIAGKMVGGIVGVILGENIERIIWEILLKISTRSL